MVSFKCKADAERLSSGSQELQHSEESLWPCLHLQGQQSCLREELRDRLAPQETQELRQPCQSSKEGRKNLS